MFFKKKKHHNHHVTNRPEVDFRHSDEELFDDVPDPFDDGVAYASNTQPEQIRVIPIGMLLRHEVDSLPNITYEEYPPYKEYQEYQPTPQQNNSNDKFIEPGVLELREATERELPDDLKNLGTYMRAANAAVAERLANDMAATYRVHLATIMELQTQMNLQAAMDNRIAMQKALANYLSKREF